MNGTFEEMVLKALTDQMIGGLTSDEYISEIKRIFEVTVSYEQLHLQRESIKAHAAHCKNIEKIQNRQLKALEKIVKFALKDPS